ncbi:2-hydroxyhepta-2,4-diene-1,7-dioate isomerase [Mesorhizobium hungaricum]|jgi:2-keto-4-pentenoate hydratase/2-oxohepta-3-ene-1,7-dioic acid hydratase in catechol pathway|uniref:2-hydroxyhepta-2,4-diene-1,7-dioate isomerase n=1 Tax=Mesorhizobium hungaricum TaxID=1566387 RepID=A0A1C2E3J4_9HYPH|nr:MULTISPECIES: fumarylacetoacetate hydrolase family protein [Mesorhizobium]MBN9235816.1 fumarylacetoacetate hydrolase family protein [Mesorhizobium sp.]MDQ0333090.1 2-keto-4-pentenoate hydratase/2-oxohepta-3-ene-1,7-dioic acid hydratase in catechol pathway [Mesorhizobium sp. YL-MeA3-2017]OCX21476.1 2-hydroxyhepta-2,4-diene-1,7-dioate isomerase [Mesorhizobium hungaricum]
MKLLRIGPVGQERPAILDQQGNARDLSAQISDLSGETLTPEGLSRISALDIESLPILTVDRIGPCVGQIGKFICIGLNYTDHAAEANLPTPSEPIIFMKATSAICGPNDRIIIPRGATKCDWEVELGVVIGKGGAYIAEADAMAHVAGYCVVNDISERTFQMERGGQWTKGKSADTFGPLGPWLVTADDVPDPQNLSIWLEVDGRRYQDGSTKTMIFPVPHLVHYVSQFMSLQPGDVIATGTPPGVGMGQKPPVYLTGAETMRLGVESLGEQIQVVRSHPARIP